MENIYEVNGLMFWDREQIRLRRVFEEHFLSAIERCLIAQNKAFRFFQIEAPILTPRDRINPNYTDEDFYSFATRAVHTNPTPNELLALRPETTMGSYAYAQWLLNSHQKVQLPICVWQHGKSFRREQDQPTKFMRLKEFYQQEFQIIYSPTTAKDYSVELIPVVRAAMSRAINFECRVEDSDRLPNYAEWTKDIVCEATTGDMEVCSISSRKDFPGAKVLEVAIGTDRCIYNYQQFIPF